MMRSWSLAEITPVMNAALQDGDLFFTQVSTDTRTLEPGALYVALRGERFDGHDFIDEAVRRGACAVVADRAVDTIVPVIRVEDTLRALGQLGAMNRGAFRRPLVAVTGSCGKTTTKEMLLAVLGLEGNTLATRGNLNNAIGAPLTLLRLAPNHDFAVIELGASAEGDIAWTGSLTRPDVGIITNASEAHLTGFGSLEQVVRAKGEMIDSVGVDGTVVLNRDDVAFPQWYERAGDRKVVNVSAQGNEAADLYATDIAEDSDGVHFRMHAGEEVHEIRIPLAGRHNVANALLVAAAVRALSINTETLVRGLAQVPAVSGRLEKIMLGGGLTLLDDSYNANPASMGAALDALAATEGARYALLGDMAELGEVSAQHHRRIGALAASLQLDGLGATGDYADEYVRGFGEGAWSAKDKDSLVENFLSRYSAPATVLVKGSRSTGMDRVVASLKQRMDS